jgi:hypothetical protein
MHASPTMWWRLAAIYAGTAGLQIYLALSTGQTWAVVLASLLAVSAQLRVRRTLR